MTIIDVQNYLFKSFLDKDVISVQSIVNSIEFDEKDNLSPEEKRKLVELSLKHLKEVNMIDQISDEKWIVRKNFLYEPQTVEIYPETANLISNFCNSYYKTANIAGGEVNALSITDEDIKSVCHIGSLLLNLLSNQEK